MRHQNLNISLIFINSAFLRGCPERLSLIWTAMRYGGAQRVAGSSWFVEHLGRSVFIMNVCFCPNFYVFSSFSFNIRLQGFAATTSLPFFTPTRCQTFCGWGHSHTQVSLHGPSLTCHSGSPHTPATAAASLRDSGMSRAVRWLEWPQPLCGSMRGSLLYLPW